MDEGRGTRAGSPEPTMTARLRLMSAEARAVVERLGLTLPTSAAMIEAEELAFQTSPTELYRHVVRSYLYAASLGAAAGAQHDGEMLAVGCLLHDVGLT